MIPHELLIGSQTYKIKYVNKSAMPDLLGEVDTNLNIIRLYKRLPATRKVEVALHEVIHAMLNSIEFPQEEQVVAILGEALAQFIRDNPDFISHLQKTL